MAWRLAKSLDKLRQQINLAYPKRKKVSDGTIGDTAHSTKTSDHNPNDVGVVNALDITHDPANGVNIQTLADNLKKQKDERVKYIIVNGKIWNPSVSPDWRPYTGSNAHTKHIHISVRPEEFFYDSTNVWNIGSLSSPTSVPTTAKTKSAKVYVYCLYGLGGRIWSRAIEDYIAATLRKNPNYVVLPTVGYTQWRYIAEQIRMQPAGSKAVVIGHSMGGITATYVTDKAHVDLIVCYDPAGMACSGIGKNCERLLDFEDVAFDLVPEFRPWAYPGHEKKIEYTKVALGHTRCPSSPELLAKVVAAVKKL